jgi:hypothetical protein
MAQPARRQDLANDEIPIDPRAVELAYRRERARRRARERRKEERNLARFRFYAVMLALLAGAVALVVVIWEQVQRLFGL